MSDDPPSTPTLSDLDQESSNPNNTTESTHAVSAPVDVKTEDKIDEKKEEKKEESTPTPNLLSVQDVGVCADQNWKYRRRMEDAHYYEDNFLGDPTQGFFAVYDGHGGKEAAIFSSNNLHKVLAELINKESVDLQNVDQVIEILKKTYLQTDSQIAASVPNFHGCTAVTVLISGKGDNKHLYAANVGDARAVLCRDGKAIRLTEEHKASDAIEAKRIADAGGFIIHGRVNGQIMITRSLGDHLMKEYIIGDPYTHHEKLTEKDTWLIVACDGLWDVIEDQPAVDFVLEHHTLSASEISKKLLIKALQDGTTDNLSIMVVKL